MDTLILTTTNRQKKINNGPEPCAVWQFALFKLFRGEAFFFFFFLCQQLCVFSSDKASLT